MRDCPTDRQNRNDKRQRELEAEIRSLRKQLVGSPAT